MAKRSVWKGPYISYFLYKNLKDFINLKKNEIKTRSRSSSIVPAFLGQTIKVYTGRAYMSLQVKKEMLGYKLGAFVPTRHVMKVQKKKSKKKKKK